MFSKRNKGSSVFSLNHEQYLTLAEANEKKQNRIRATHIHAQHAYFVLLTCTPNVDEECVAVVFYSRKVTRLLELVSAHMWQLVVAATTIRLINMVFSHEFHFVYIYVHPFQLARTILRLLPLLFFPSVFLCFLLFVSHSLLTISLFFIKFVLNFIIVIPPLTTFCRYFTLFVFASAVSCFHSQSLLKNAEYA